MAGTCASWRAGVPSMCDDSMAWRAGVPAMCDRVPRCAWSLMLRGMACGESVGARGQALPGMGEQRFWPWATVGARTRMRLAASAWARAWNPGRRQQAAPAPEGRHALAENERSSTCGTPYPVGGLHEGVPGACFRRGGRATAAQPGPHNCPPGGRRHLLLRRRGAKRC